MFTGIRRTGHDLQPRTFPRYLRDLGGKEYRIIDRPSATRAPGQPLRIIAGMVALLAFGIAAPAALATSPIPEQLPSATPGAAAPAGSAAPAPVAPAPVAGVPLPAAAATRPVTTTTASTGVLSAGSRGNDVKSLQRKLRLKGIRVPVDGSYGRLTRAGVRILQRKLRLEPTGIADAALLKKLGVKIRQIASTPSATPVAIAPVAVAVAKYLKAFPVVGEYSYGGDFGARRHQGSHEGNDIMAARGTPLVAVADGVIKRLTRDETGLGGIWVWLRDNEGNEYYYAHMDQIVVGLTEGAKVAVGQPIGTVGNSGDARYGAPHVHFEIHPGGGGAIDPNSDLVAVDPKKG